MPNRDEWLAYSRIQPELGVPALYYVESIDNSREDVTDADLDEIAGICGGPTARLAASGQRRSRPRYERVHRGRSRRPPVRGHLQRLRRDGGRGRGAAAPRRSRSTSARATCSTTSPSSASRPSTPS